MKQFISLVIKEGRHILRDKRTMLILFVMPVLLMLIFGFAITNDIRNVRVVVVTTNMDRQVIDRLDASHLRREAYKTLSKSLLPQTTGSEYFSVVATVPTPREAEMFIRSQRADIAVINSPDNTSIKHNGASASPNLQLMVDAADPNMAQQWLSYAQNIISMPQDGGTLAHSPVNVKMLYNPQMKSAYNFVPGIMGMLLLLICAMMTSVSIVREKEKGTMEVLLVSPVQPLVIIIAKAVPYLLQAFLVLLLILIMSFTVLGIPMAGSLVWVIVVSLIYILLALSLGLLISNIAKTQFVALLVSAMVLLLPTVMLSGMLFPVESMPQPLQWIAFVIPPRYYIQAMRKLMIMGVGINEVLPEVIMLSLMTLLLLLVSLKKFNSRLE